MSKTIRVDDLANEIAKELKNYSDVVTDDLKEACKEVAKNAAKEIKDNSPKQSGEYKKGWKTKIAYNKGNDIRVVVYNANKPQLTHLLENGHAKVGGGRVEGHPHIAPAEQNAISALEGKVKVIVR